MKTKFLFAFVLFSTYCFSQSINDYKAVIVPLKFDFIKTDNQYRLATLTKFNLEKAGFTAFYANEELPQQYTAQRCDLLNVNVVRDNAFLITKLYVEFKDCYGKVVYTSEIGKSKTKEYEPAYKEALDGAFVSVNELNYAYNGTVNKSEVGKKQTTVQATAIAATAVTSAKAVESSVPMSTINSNTNSVDVLYAQPTETGYQLIDKTPKVVMKLMKTSQPDSFIAIKNGVQGSLINKNNQWFFEYYKDDKLVSEPISVKF